jgi:hypothetical protein
LRNIQIGILKLTEIKVLRRYLIMEENFFWTIFKNEDIIYYSIDVHILKMGSAEFSIDGLLQNKKNNYPLGNLYFGITRDNSNQSLWCSWVPRNNRAFTKLK